MRVSYYPGCSLRGTARDYAASVEAVCGLLDIELCELEDWNCCGATAAHSLNRRVSVDLAGRNLAIAEAARIPDLVAPCPLCFNRLKSAEHELTGGRRDAYRVSMAGDRVTVWDLANFLAAENLLDRMEARIQQDLTGLKAVCYYGCMASRPPDITGERLYENPMSMDRVLERLGVEAIQWSYKTDCCGAGHLVARPDIVFALVGKLYESARRAGADCMVVSCQMCQANLDMHQDKILKEMGAHYRLPVLYFTELMGLALAHKGAPKWLKRHMVDPSPLIAEKCGFGG
ncbi:MAG: CoB--CoM heterodisulfide reductase iron-sulfur subunit B family protein [Deltaproteobacteria bacterium]|nr:CoB--CoM heterodisulfide reductase iron-sulfur subunit B family protein [Deltaproteobacteria bacterium]